MDSHQPEKPKTPTSQKDAPSLRAEPSSFYWAMRLLPREQREAIFEIYSFCRAVDDIADGDLSPEDKIDLLSDWQHRIDDIMDGTEAVAFADGFSKTIQSYRIDRDDLLAIIDGMKSDSVENLTLTDMNELNVYMDRVASAVGKISNKIFGLKGDAANDLAVNLGRALQLTNILRDISDDAKTGRIYIPLSVLNKFSVHETEPMNVLTDKNLPQALEYMASMAHDYFSKANNDLLSLPREKTRSARIMKAVYQRILSKMIKRGWDYPLGNERIGKFEKIIIAVRETFLV